MPKGLTNKKASPQNVERQEKKLKALEYRLMHFSSRSIAEKLGVSHQTVMNYLNESMDELRRQETHKAADYRMMELQRLERASAAIMKPVLEGEISAVDEYRKLSESRRKLLGLDSPFVHEIVRGDKVDLSELSDEELLAYGDSGGEASSEATS